MRDVCIKTCNYIKNALPNNDWVAFDYKGWTLQETVSRI
jgi:hypothetical protein